MISPLLQAEVPKWRTGDRAAHNGRSNGTITRLSLSTAGDWKEGIDVDEAPRKGATGVASIKLDNGEHKWCPLSSLTPPI